MDRRTSPPPPHHLEEVKEGNQDTKDNNLDTSRWSSSLPLSLPAARRKVRSGVRGTRSPCSNFLSLLPHLSRCGRVKMIVYECAPRINLARQWTPFPLPLSLLSSFLTESRASKE